MAKKKKTSKKKATTTTKRNTSARSKKTAKAGSRTSTKKKKTAAKPATKKKTSSKAAPASSNKKKTKSTTKTAAPSKKTSTSKKKSTAGSAKADSKKKTSKKTTKKTTKKKRSSGSSTSTRGHSVAEAAAMAKADSKGYVFINGRRVRMISSKAAGTTKKVTKKKTTSADAASAPDKPKAVKTKLTRKELNYYRKLLLEKRRELVGDLDGIEQEALRKSGDSTHMPIHMADIGSDTYEQDFMLGLAENERNHLREIDEALMRIKNNTYGMCLMTGKQIPAARLEAKPWAKYTIEAALQIEGSYGR